MLSPIKSIALLVGILFPVVVFSAKVTDLYHAVIPVPAQTHDIREKAVQEAFVSVLTKLTGDYEVIKNPVIKQAQRRANYYVQDYNYSSPNTNAYNVFLKVNFTKPEIDQLIKQADLVTWGEDRPLILAWLIFKDGKEVEIIGSENHSPILNNLITQSQRNALPLIFPVMDVTDLAQVTPEDIQTNNEQKLLNAAKRYGVDGILVGTIEQTKFNIKSQWKLVLDKKQWNWKFEDKDESEISKLVVNKVTQALAKQFLEQRTPKEIKLSVVINQVNQRDDLIKLMKYLQEITNVKQTQLFKVNGDSVELSILIRGTFEQFNEYVKQGRHLLFKSQADNKYIFDWLH